MAEKRTPPKVIEWEKLAVSTMREIIAHSQTDKLKADLVMSLLSYAASCQRVGTTKDKIINESKQRGKNKTIESGTLTPEEVLARHKEREKLGG